MGEYTRQKFSKTRRNASQLSSSEEDEATCFSQTGKVCKQLARDHLYIVVPIAILYVGCVIGGDRSFSFAEPVLLVLLLLSRPVLLLWIEWYYSEQDPLHSGVGEEAYRSSTQLSQIDSWVHSIIDTKANIQNQCSRIKSIPAQLLRILVAIATFVCTLAAAVDVMQRNESSCFDNRLLLWRTLVALAVPITYSYAPALRRAAFIICRRNLKQKGVYLSHASIANTLATCTTVCTGLSGILTTGEMSVRNFFTLEDRDCHVSRYEMEAPTQYGGGIANLRRNGAPIQDALAYDSALDMLVNAAILCSKASGGRCPYNTGVKGNPAAPTTEASISAALVHMAESLLAHNGGRNFLSKISDRSANWQIVKQAEFSEENSCTSVITVPIGNVRTQYLFTQGDAGQVLLRSTRVMLRNGIVVALTPSLRRCITKTAENFAETTHALRCIGLAFRPINNTASDKINDPNDTSCELTFLGVCSVVDLPRRNVRAYAENFLAAGMRTVVLTGSEPTAAESIARETGIVSPREAKHAQQSVFSREEFSSMTHEDKLKAVNRGTIFSGLGAKEKAEIIELLQSLGHVCATVSIGSSIAFFQESADVMVAMDGEKTRFGRQADVVIVENDLAKVLDSIVRCRSALDSADRYLICLLMSSVANMVCVLGTTFLRIPSAVSPVHLLLVGSVVGNIAPMSLLFGEPDRTAGTPIQRGVLWLRYASYIFSGVYIGLASIAGFLWCQLMMGAPSEIGAALPKATEPPFPFPSYKIAQTISCSILMVSGLLCIVGAMSNRLSVTVIRPSSNPALVSCIVGCLLLHLFVLYIPAVASAFHMTALGVSQSRAETATRWSLIFPDQFIEWKVILLLSIPVVFIHELAKLTLCHLEAGK